MSTFWTSSHSYCVIFGVIVTIYNRLFNNENPSKKEGFLDCININSLQIYKNCKLEPSLANATLKDKFQFIRHGYFVLDLQSNKDTLIFKKVDIINW